MTTVEIMLIAMGLSMDAFAVSVCKGLSFVDITTRDAGAVGLYFGAFQAGMPLVGFVIGRGFYEQIQSVDHWIAFALLLFIGVRMMRESRRSPEHSSAATGAGEMLMLSVATSIDALAVGITFAFLGLNIVQACLMIGITTFSFSVAGTYIGHYFGAKFKAPAEMIGGLILIVIGLKILIEHLGA